MTIDHPRSAMAMGHRLAGKVKSRKPTGFVAQPMKAGVWTSATWDFSKPMETNGHRTEEVGFEDYDDDVEEVEVEKTPKRKVHGRTPTAFVKKPASADVSC